MVLVLVRGLARIFLRLTSVSIMIRFPWTYPRLRINAKGIVSLSDFTILVRSV